MIAGLVCLAVTAALFAWFDLAVSLGAHPFWGTSVVLWGAVLGAVMHVGLRRQSASTTAGLASALTVTGYALAYLGKLRFAASYAEDQIAGRFWYFGWIIACLGALLLVASIGTRVWHRR